MNSSFTQATESLAPLGARTGVRISRASKSRIAPLNRHAAPSPFPSPPRGRGNPSASGRPSARRAFTLIELILVLVLLATILAITAPSLSKFFRGRSLDSEAKRFLALTRLAQSRAVSEGVPMVVWLQTEQRSYGLNADKSFVEEDEQAEQFALDSALQMEVLRFSGSMTASQTNQFRNEKSDTGSLHTLRFNPDGFVSLTSAEAVVFRQGEAEELWVAQSRNRMNYEIYASKPTTARR
jgi:type II secretion system protein H